MGPPPWLAVLNETVNAVQYKLKQGPWGLKENILI